MGRPQLDEKTKRKNIKKLINCARNLIDEHGIQNVTIRAIADRADMNSATMYNYFHDLDELVTYACISYFQEYCERLNAENRYLSENEPEEVYLMTWDLFCQYSFRHPEEMYQLFFGKYSGELKTVIRKYYQWFPEETENLTQNLQDMMEDADMFERNIRVLRPILPEGTSEKDLTIMNELTVAYLQMLLRELSDNEKGDYTPEGQRKRMMEVCVFLTENITGSQHSNL